MSDGDRPTRLGYLIFPAALGVGCLPAAAALWGMLPHRWAALTPPVLFVATSWLLATARPTRRPLLSPRNILYGGFAIQLVVAPLLFLVAGPVEWVFPVPQAWGSVAVAALLIGLSFPCWALGAAVYSHIVGAPKPRPAWDTVQRNTIAWFVVFGLSGVGLLALEVQGDAIGATSGAADGVVQVLRLTLRPFLAVAGVVLLSNALIDKTGEPATRRDLLRLAVAVLLIVISYASVDLRRAPALAAFLALLAAYSLMTNRPSPRALVLLGAAGAVAFIGIRVLRSPDVPFGALFNSTGEQETLLTGLNTEIQSYAGGMQHVAFLLDHVRALGGFLDGQGQIFSALAPVPGLGGPVRDSTPGALYNALFLMRSDQVLPLAGHFYLDMGPAAVAVGFVLLGAICEALNRAFMQSGTLIEAFVWATPAAWLAFSLGSGPVGFYQSLIYFSLPAYILVASNLLRRRQAAPA